MGFGPGTGCDWTVLRSLGLLLGIGFCFGSLLFVLSLSLLLSSLSLSVFLSLSLSWLDLQDQAACFLTTT